MGILASVCVGLNTKGKEKIDTTEARNYVPKREQTIEMRNFTWDICWKCHIYYTITSGCGQQVADLAAPLPSALNLRLDSSLPSLIQK